MNEVFDVYVTKDRLSASLTVKNNKDLDSEHITFQSLQDWLQTKKIVFGVDYQALQFICDNPRNVTYPIQIAKGIHPENGRDGYLINEAGKEEQAEKTDEDHPFNFRNILKIPSVASGQMIATIVPPTAGIPGKDVYGNLVHAKLGKQLRLRPGKNVLFQHNKIWATTDGQISISSNSVNVFPVFEVKGDLDLNTGNIDFIGNVVIDGNVPSEYEIKAGGDVKITGLVEGATIEAQGSIHISGGIAGQKKAVVKAGVDLHTQYVNQAIVFAGNDIGVDQFIMHSEVTAGNRLLCPKAHIIGGKTSAGFSIEAREIGNQHFARTELFIGLASEVIEQERRIVNEIKNMKDSLTKLSVLKGRLEERKRLVGKLTASEEGMLTKQHDTAIVFVRKLTELEKELELIHEQMHQTEQGFVSVHDQMYPNNVVTFSKYSKVIQQPLTYVKLYVDQGEIASVPL